MENKITLKIGGMTCASCAKVIKYGLEEEKGVKNVDVDFNSGKTSLEFNPAETNIEKINNKIKNLGYKAIQE